MAWFRTDDKLHSHPKARKAGLEAMGLWVIAGSYSMDYGTDGFVPDWFVKSWPNGVKLAGKLVKAKLWSAADHDDESGYRFHDWHDFQPTLDDLAGREDKREGGRLGAHRRWHKIERSPDCPYCAKANGTPNGLPI